VRKQRIPIMTTSALGFIAICIVVIGAWGIFPRGMSQTLATQEQVSPAELSPAIEAQREASAKLTRSASFDQRIQKLREKAQKKGTVSVIVRVRAAFRPEGQISNAAEALAQRKVIEEAQDQMLSWLRYMPSTLKRYESLPYIAASVDATGLEQLQSSSEALAISEDMGMHLILSESLPRVGAPRAWAGNFKGTGKTIAVLDSGVPCTVLGGSGYCGHGTHIAGIAAGRTGVAYGANIISIREMSFVDDSEECRGQAPCLLARSSDVISALSRVYELRTTYCEERNI
jgi:subtilisin family serine protease